MNYRKPLRKSTAALLSLMLCYPSLSALSLPASGRTTSGKAVRYVMTETPAGMRYVDADGNMLQEQLIPHKNMQPLTSAAETADLPSRYDMREEGLITSVKSQFGGTCWAYGAMGAIESNMIKQGMGDTSLDLSEAHMIWFGRGQGGPEDATHPLHGDGVALGTEAYKQGGGLYWVTGPLLAWEGVAYESEFPAHSEEQPLDESYRFRSVAHLQHMRKFSKNDMRTVKETLLEKGALGFSYFIPEGIECMSEQCGFYQTVYDPSQKKPEGLKGGGHTVTLIGWDDNFPKENFIETPPGDGAWILRNNWGTHASRTEEGFFYMSYYEKTINDITLFDMEPVDNYSSIYQYDGDSDTSYTTGFGADTGFIQANVFKAERNENITAIGFYINDVSMPYEAAIYLLNDDYSDPRDGTLVTEVSGQTDYIGYYTVPLPPGCGIQKGKYFSVVVKTAPCSHTTCHFDRHCFAPRTSYFTVYNAEEEEPWKDCYSEGRGNVNVKAYTTYGQGLCETFCPSALIREHLSAEFDTDHDMIVTHEEFVASGHPVPYDISGDEIVDARDLTLLKRAVLGEQQLGSGYKWYYGDWNADMNLSKADAQFLFDYLFQRPHTGN